MTDNIQNALTNNFMLVSLHTTNPPKTRTDKRATAEVNAKEGAGKGASHVVKNIWGPKGTSPAIEALTAMIATANRTHTEMTMPWTPYEAFKSGVRLLQNDRFFDYVPAMNKHKSAIADQLTAIEPQYQSIVANAMTELGAMADPSVYPAYEELKAKVGLRFSYKPVPIQNDFKRIQLPAKLVDQIAAMSVSNTQREVENLTRAAWEGILVPLTNIVEQTSKEKGRIFESLYANLQVVVANLADFNIKDDPEMEKTRRELVRIMSVYSLEDVRKDPIARADLNEDAKRVVESMANLGWAA